MALVKKPRTELVETNINTYEGLKLLHELISANYLSRVETSINIYEQLKHRGKYF